MTLKNVLSLISFQHKQRDMVKKNFLSVKGSIETNEGKVESNDENVLKLIKSLKKVLTKQLLGINVWVLKHLTRE
jgi:hypothetical protein